ncbi:hypothetical protein MDMS009_1351 [Methylophaga thiooxydans DMS010]|uniref:Uncharacterized protein n=1 Tax=Methylophaga thiooxydans DMS010 TaxID=637616 RepID=C0N5Z5_9GAMM|nr:hypothetical protein MDMS009_1351 [Methylophaga thiooxydans DMS010]
MTRVLHSFASIEMPFFTTMAHKQHKLLSYQYLFVHVKFT